MIPHGSPLVRSPSMLSFTLPTQLKRLDLSGHLGRSPWSASVALFNPPSRIDGTHIHVSADMSWTKLVSPKFNYYTTCKIGFRFELNHTPNSLLFILIVRCMFRASIQLPFHTLTFWSHCRPNLHTPPTPNGNPSRVLAFQKDYSCPGNQIQHLCSSCSAHMLC